MDIKTLLPQLKKLVTELSEDLLARSLATAEIEAGLREAYTQIEKGGRTADPFEVWRDDYLDQVAVAWVLGCVFVRFMEDNHLIDECWLAGQGERRKQAEDTHELYFRENPRQSDRDYFEHVFHEVGKIPACRDLFAEGKTPLWAVGPSGDAAMKLLAFWREIDTDSGQLKRTFEVEDGDTRFLGDLYQDLSEKARKKYALLQTPVFVEEFILDRTLNPAINEFGLEIVRMIDPTCGSGHFLLGGFARLFDLWAKREDNEIVAAQKALDGVWGCDINPFAVAIARFRLIVAALKACGIDRLKRAPAWNIHLATGDSLLFGSHWDRDGNKLGEQKFLVSEEESWAPEIYACEDKGAISEVLGQQYHVVVGNPPYIIVRDRVLNAAYRSLYTSCGGKYSLGVPFTQRMWGLGLRNFAPEATAPQGAGYVGLITANSFMKREFGKRLIEQFLPTVNLTHVIDTSGAFIPGHSTPTVILLGRASRPVDSSVRAVLGIKGEQSTSDDPSQGQVWQALISQIDVVGYQDDFISTADVPRTTFNSHPWSVGGGGAAELKELLDTLTPKTLSEMCDIGIGVVTLEDDVYQLSSDVVRRMRFPAEYLRGFVVGDIVRDWSVSDVEPALFPHDATSFAPVADETIIRWLWPYRTSLSNRLWFRKTQLQRGMKWFEYGHISIEKFRTPFSIAFAFVAWQNHFVLDRGGKIFNRSAPIIKLPADASEDEHFGLLGLLNSSTGCFWMKQVTQIKTQTTGMDSEAWQFRREFDGTKLKAFPVPDDRPVHVAHRLDKLARQLRGQETSQILSHGIEGVNLQALLDNAKATNESLNKKMIALQEELDWECYKLYAVLEDDLVYESNDLPEVTLGERAFEIVMARQMKSGELHTTWFERHDATPVTEIPTHWPQPYRTVVERRIETILSNKEIALIEKAEYKRRWQADSRKNQHIRALRVWLLERMENIEYWPDFEHSEPRLQSVAALSDKASGDNEFLQVAAIYQGRDDFDVAALVSELIEQESIPFLPILRLKLAGIRKRKVWERTWELQRKEDAGDDVGEIKVPPKYTSADFLTSDYWRLRGKLDVPKERWISFPHCETASDPSLVVGWAGWNHLQQGTAIVAYYDARKNEGWSAEQLMPLLAALDQLLPWIHQWHPEIDPEYNETAGTSFQTLLESEAQELGLTLEQIRNWTPPVRQRAAKKAASSQPRKPRATRKKAAATEVEEEQE